jgi:nucleoside-diphosphate-sugar epimerase
MVRIALIGAGGFVGKAVHAALLKVPHYEVTGVTLETYEKDKEGEYDIVINSAMPSGRFWAKANPQDDFRETVGKTANILYDWKAKKFVQISTISARSQRDTIYGRHKAAAEALLHEPNHLIIRLVPMYGETLKKGVLIDMLEGKTVYVHPESRYGFAPLEFIAEWIAKNIEHRTGVVEVGAKDGVALKELADYLGGGIPFEGDVLDHQEVQAPEDDFPPARNVIQFLDERRKRKAE